MAFRISALCTPLKDSNSENLIFKTKQQREIYFHLSQLRNGAPCNFNIKNGIDSECYVDTDLYENNNNYYQQILGLGSPLHCNYCVIYDDDNSLPEWDKYRFYFINKIEHDTQRRQFKLYLHLDSFQTYYPYLKFEDCFIERAHLDRFYTRVNPQSQRVNVVNFKKDSYLLKNENFNISNTYIQQKGLLAPTQCDFAFSDLNDWLHNNVLYWKYYFIKNMDFVNVNNVPYETTVLASNGTDTIRVNAIHKLYYTEQESDIICLVAPILKKNKYITIRYNHITYYFGDESINSFIKKYNLSSNIISCKLSKLSPFCFTEQLFTGFSDYEISDTGLSIKNILNILNNADYFMLNEGVAQCCLNIKNTNPLYDMYLDYAYNYDKLRDFYNYRNRITIDYDEYTDDQIKENYIKTKEKIYNEIEININGEKYSYNLGSLNSRDIMFKYYETIIPDISRFVADLYSYEREQDYLLQYNDKIYENITGSFDQFLLFSVEKYDEFIVNNKNFYQAFNYKQKVKAVEAAGDIALGIIGIAAGYGIGVDKGNEFAAINAGVQNIPLASRAMHTFVDIASDKQIMQYSMENLKKAPPSIESINGNIYLNALYNNLEIYYVYRVVSESDIQQIEYYFRKYGYSVSKFAQIKSTEIQPRKYFNYVKANVDNVFIDKTDMWGNTIDYPFVPFLSNELINDIKRVFKNGIAIWKVAEIIPTFEGVEFDYTINNYEERFDNE